VISVCSGVGTDAVAWHSLGWEHLCFAEIEKFPSAVLKHRWPEIPNYGDFTKICSIRPELVTSGAGFVGNGNGGQPSGDGQYAGTRASCDLCGGKGIHLNEPADLLVGGTPCQSFSVAGLRGGLADDRGNLALEFLRLADRTRPRWVVWENVPGVISSLSHNAPDPCPPPPPLDMELDGQELETEDEYSAEELHALNCFVAGLAELGYGWAMRVLDAQYFGVPQRRRRVFVVGHLGDWRRAAAVLFERHSLQGNNPPSREARKGIAGGVEVGPSGGRLTDTHPTLDTRCKDGFIRNQLGGGRTDRGFL
jgi:DNA (cytosine-5)-methyltransferase 1